MSTKIYNGFMFRDTDYGIVLSQLKRLQKELYPLATQLLAQVIAEELVSSRDTQYFSQTPETKSLSVIHVELVRWQKEIKGSGNRDPSVDFGFDVSVIPDRSPRVPANLLGIFYTEQGPFINVLKAKRWFIDYSYWNNSDRPDDISEQAWKTRCRHWDAALGKDGIPSIAGFSFTVIANELIRWPSVEAILEKQPPVANRAKRIAEELLYQKWRQRQPESKLKQDPIAAVMEFMDVLRDNPNTQEAFLQLKDQWTQKLTLLTKVDLGYKD
jgi:hypothetical protein